MRDHSGLRVKTIRIIDFCYKGRFRWLPTNRLVGKTPIYLAFFRFLQVKRRLAILPRLTREFARFFGLGQSYGRSDYRSTGKKKKGTTVSKYEIKNVGPISARQAASLAGMLKSKLYDDETAVQSSHFGEPLALWEIVQSWNPEGLLVDGTPSKKGSYELLNILLNTEAQPLIGYLKGCPDAPKEPAAPKGLTTKVATSAPQIVEKPKVAAPQLTVAPAPQDSRVDRLEAMLLEMMDRLTAPQSVPAEPVALQPTAGHQIVITDDGPVQLVKGANGRYYVRTTIA